MNELQVRTVPFMGTDLMAAKDETGQIWAGVSYICNGMGMTKHQKDRQIANVQSGTVLSKGCIKFEAGVFDANNETIALQLDFVPLWLAKISITPAMQRDNPDLADKLVQYQLKAKDVLAAAFIDKKPMTQLEITAANAQALVAHERELAAIKEHQTEQDAKIEEQNAKISGMANILASPPTTEERWQEDTNAKINSIVEQNNYNHQTYRQKLYDILERRAKCDLHMRQVRMKKRMAEAGKGVTQQKLVTKLYIVAIDPKLRAIFDGILREEQAKHLCA